MIRRASQRQMRMFRECYPRQGSGEGSDLADASQIIALPVKVHKPGFWRFGCWSCQRVRQFNEFREVPGRCECVNSGIVCAGWGEL